MKLTDEVFIAAPREDVYAALNDVEVLKDCIPGCEELVRHSDTELKAKVLLKVGPFTLTGSGSGGTAGFAKGGADVVLQEQDGGTCLTYEAHADIGGKLAQLGSRLVQGTAKKLSARFFKAFAVRVTTCETALVPGQATSANGG